VGWGGCEIAFCVCRRGVDRVCLGGAVKVFLTIYICSINLLLLFDNTTGMTHLKITYILLKNKGIVH